MGKTIEKKKGGVNMKGYKGFNKDMTCMNIDYKEGKDYKMKGKIYLCSTGYHFCTDPLDVLSYYDLFSSAFASVTALGKIKSDDCDSKKVTNHIQIGNKLSLKNFIREIVYFVIDTYKKKKRVASNRLCSNKMLDVLAAADEYDNFLASSGYKSKMAVAGNNNNLAAAGEESRLFSHGENNNLVTAGCECLVVAEGDHNLLASTGDYTDMLAIGDNNKLVSLGDNTALKSKGKNAIVAGLGDGCKVMGKKGNWLILVEHDKKDNVKTVKTRKVDGKKIKEDVWYILQDGIFIED